MAPLSLDRIWQAARGALGLHSLRGHMVILAVACILPMIAFSGLAVMRYADAQRVAALVPAADTMASLRTSLEEIGLAAAAMLVFGILLAGAVGKRFVRSLRRLSVEASALGRGVAVSPARTGTAEVDEVLDALEAAGRLLLERSRQRDEAERSLRAGEQRFRDIAETAADWFWESDSAHRFTSDAGGQV